MSDPAKAPPRWHTVVRPIAAIVFTLPVALLSCAWVARYAPLPADTRFALSFLALIPLWLTLMCLAFASARPLHTLLSCLLATAMMAVGLSYH